MAIFISKDKKKKYDLSRVPHGDLTVGPYIIRPYTSNLQQLLDEHLNALLNSETKCIDGQNGNVLDNLIESWKKRAKNGIDKQKAYHLERIRNLDFDRKSSLQNANDWLKADEKKLIELTDELRELEVEAKELKKEMPKW